MDLNQNFIRENNQERHSRLQIVMSVRRHKLPARASLCSNQSSQRSSLPSIYNPDFKRAASKRKRLFMQRMHGTKQSRALFNSKTKKITLAIDYADDVHRQLVTRLSTKEMPMKTHKIFKPIQSPPCYYYTSTILRKASHDAKDTRARFGFQMYVPD